MAIGAPASPEQIIVQASLGTPEKTMSPGQEVARSVRGIIDRDDTPAPPLEKTRNALKTFIERRPPEIGVSKGAKGVIEGNFGTDRDPETGAIIRTPESEARLDGTKTFEALARGAVNYDTLTDAQKLQALTSAEDVLKLDPLIEATLPKDPIRRRKWIEDRYLKEPGVIAKIQAEHQRLSSSEARLIDEVTPAKLALNEAATELEKRKAEQERIQGELNAATTRIGEFEPGQTEANRLKELTEKLPQNQEALKTKEAELADLTSEIDELRKVRINLSIGRPPQPTGDITAQIRLLQEEARQLLAPKASISGEIAEHARLIAEKPRLEQEQSRLEGQLRVAQSEVQTAVTAKSIAQANVEGAQFDRSEAEDGYVAEWQGIISRSVAEYAQEQLQLGETAYQTYIEELAEKSTDVAEKALVRQLSGNRWKEEKAVTVAGKVIMKRRVTKESLVKNDVDAMIDPTRGAKTIVEQMLRSELATEVTAGRMTQAQLDEVVKSRMGDGAFVEKWTPLVAEPLLRERLKLGKLSDSQQEAIANSEVGRQILDRAMKNPSEIQDPKRRAQVEALRNSGIDTVDKMDKFSRSELLLALLLGGLILGVTTGVKAGATSMSDSNS